MTMSTQGHNLMCGYDGSGMLGVAITLTRWNRNTSSAMVDSKESSKRLRVGVIQWNEYILILGE